MRLRVLGAHNSEAKGIAMTSLLIDGVLALDAGSLSSALTLGEQAALGAVLLTHGHFDHTRDIVTVGFNQFNDPIRATLPVYGPSAALEIVQSHLLDDAFYLDMTKRPSPERPTVALHAVAAGDRLRVAGYEVLVAASDHAVPTVGYQITDTEGRRVFYGGDSGAGGWQRWRETAPDLLVMETTFSDEDEDVARRTLHLTPRLLRAELLGLKRHWGRLPRVLIVHMDPRCERDIRRQVSQMASELLISVRFGFEGMILEV